jgi:hypothetical protein
MKLEFIIIAAYGNMIKTLTPSLSFMNHFSPCRIEYDAYRTDLELLAQAPRTDVNTARLEEAQQSYELHKVNFEKLRSDVSIKLKFLDENRVNSSGYLVHHL